MGTFVQPWEILPNRGNLFLIIQNHSDHGKKPYIIIKEPPPHPCRHHWPNLATWLSTWLSCVAGSIIMRKPTTCLSVPTTQGFDTVITIFIDYLVYQ